MAVKNSAQKNFPQRPDRVMEALRNPRYSRLLNAELIEEAKTAECLEFRFVRKTNMSRYGRNYFLRVFPMDDGTTKVIAVTQSRKVTVIVDPYWKEEISKAFNTLELILELLDAKSE